MRQATRGVWSSPQFELRKKIAMGNLHSNAKIVMLETLHKAVAYRREVSYLTLRLQE